MLRRLRRWPTSYRTHIAVAIGLVLIITVIGQLLISQAVTSRLRAAEREALQSQAQIIADEVAGARDADKQQRASLAARFMPATRVVVTWTAKPGLYYNVTQLQRGDAEVTATSSDVEVRLMRAYENTGVSSRVVAIILVLVAAIAVIIWYLAGTITRRLRGQVADLSGSAALLAAGDRTARAIESDDELGRAARAFNLMAARLEETDAMQRRFLADVAHELRTPITSIEGFSAALEDGAAVDEEDRAEAITFIRQEAGRLRDLVSDLRDLTRYDLEPSLELAEVNLAERARHAVGRFAPQATAQDVTLIAPTTGVVIRSDPGHVDTILSNLVSNALNATSAGDRVEITVGASHHDAWVAVSDSGRGIPHDALGRIFDRLYRVDAARSRDRGGSGLGLAIVKRLVVLLGGQIAVESAPGRGTLFTVRLPLRGPARPAEPESIDHHTPTGDQQ